MKYFLDTYAIIEIIKGNEHYKKFTDEELFTNILNLYELYYNLVRDQNEVIAKRYFYQFKELLIPFTDEHLFKASQIKFKYKKRKISYADALGYGIALSHNMRFLTGDKAFKDIENVEFVK